MLGQPEYERFVALRGDGGDFAKLRFGCVEKFRTREDVCRIAQQADPLCVVFGGLEPRDHGAIDEAFDFVRALRAVQPIGPQFEGPGVLGVFLFEARQRLAGLVEQIVAGEKFDIER
jgi:hypothetical protein